MTSDIPKNGDAVTFTDRGNVFDGICNGPATEPPTHVPVFVPDTNKTFLVAISNIVEMPVIP